ncbi:cupin domain-containing protein [Paenibacillus humicola]|uniref:cupin domain-containing protein n=1 Tax=Paenibacillus humicola TaxID=3110540 RepID=UPI00237C38FC|nr:cupin domain-containing protein [Paenibacillus humicola]
MFDRKKLDFFAASAAECTLAPDEAELVLAEWTAPGCSQDREPEFIAPLHVHRSDDEAWYVLEGTLAFRIGDETVEASAGGAVIAPRGKPHTYWNPRQEPARYLIIMTARIRALIDAIHATDKRDPESMRRLFERFDSELIHSP